MLQELSRTELRDLINRVTQYGSTALEGLPKMHRLQLIHYLKYQINRIEVEANQLAATKADNNEDYNPQIHTPEYYANCYVDYDINKRLLSLVSNLGQPEPIQSDPEQSTNTKFTFENEINSSPPDDVYEHFNKYLVSQNIITENQLHQFLESAFELETPIINKIAMSDAQRKKKVYACFHTFYNGNKIQGNKRKYVKLLSDFFIGYEYENTARNWSSYDPKKDVI
tara:strand:+ start:2588 stop:3265 length:678 start_codon:yes stop_codon:yes gene_type:complete